MLVRLYSARSRVRGTLEIYHAFVRDLDATTTSQTSATNSDSSGWEDVNGDEELSTTNSVSVSSWL